MHEGVRRECSAVRRGSMLVYPDDHKAHDAYVTDVVDDCRFSAGMATVQAEDLSCMYVLRALPCAPLCASLFLAIEHGAMMGGAKWPSVFQAGTLL